MAESPAPGLPPRIYLPIVAAVSALFLAAMGWLLFVGFSTGGSLFGSGTGAGANGSPATVAPAVVNIEGGGPPPAVREQLQALRAQIARHPKDDVALTQLGDMYLAAGKYRQALPYYRRALASNPHNAAAQEGLQEARAESGGS